jgi:hypothetical protein
MRACGERAIPRLRWPEGLPSGGYRGPKRLRPSRNYREVGDPVPERGGGAAPGERERRGPCLRALLTVYRALHAAVLDSPGFGRSRANPGQRTARGG